MPTFEYRATIERHGRGYTVGQVVRGTFSMPTSDEDAALERVEQIIADKYGCDEREIKRPDIYCLDEDNDD